MVGPSELISGKYRSCPHMSVDTVQCAIANLRNFQTYKQEEVEPALHCCIKCGLRGKMKDLSFRDHFKSCLNSFVLRCSSPIELYCIRCNDYQYCSYLDKLTGRKRTIFGVSDPRKNSNKVNEGIGTQPKGFLNMGATCFMNSVLQVLCRSPLIQSEQLMRHFRDCAISNMGTFEAHLPSNINNSDLHSCIPCEFKAVCEDLHIAGDPVIIPSNLLFAIWNFVDYMAGYAQQDAHEFLIAFLNSLDQQLQVNSAEDVCSFKDVYSGEVQSNLTCTRCGAVSSTKELFIDLSLSLDIDRAYQHFSSEKLLDEESVSTDDRNTEVEEYMVDDVDLSECLHHFTALEDIKDKLFCDHCATVQRKSKQFSIVKFPEMVIFHLKRFNFLDQKKITNKVTFPVTAFNLLPFMTKSREEPLESAVDEKDHHDVLYDLKGVVCHEGTLHQGHYISYVKDSKSLLWLRCDDDEVVVVDEERVRNAEAYLLFYTKQRIQTP